MNDQNYPPNPLKTKSGHVQMKDPNCEPKPEPGLVERNRKFFEKWPGNRGTSTHTPTHPIPPLNAKTATQTPNAKYSQKVNISPPGRSTNHLSHRNSEAPLNI